MLANLTYVCLDTFANVSENITNKTDAWLTFLSSDKPEDILRLVNQYPEFAECYHDITEFRKKPEELISMFSEALIQMDKNTVQYMIEEQQKELEAKEQKLEEQQKELEAKDKELEEQAAQIARLEEALREKNKE